MKEILDDVDKWLASGEEQVALATVVQTWGSAPRKTGGKMALTAEGRITGSVSGGCVEGAVVEAGRESLQTGRPQLLHFGVADETAWEVGLACGGNISIFVEPLDKATYDAARSLIRGDQAGARVIVVDGPEALVGRQVVTTREGQILQGTLGGELDGALVHLLPQSNSAQRVTIADNIELFIDLYRPAPTLIVVGGVHTAVALTAMAKVLGYHTVVVDPRRAFGSEARFPDVDELLPLWPEKAFERLALTPDTAVALLTHDPKIDDPALKILLESPVFYIGALGSRKTHAKRLQRLQKMGFSEVHVARIHAPIGLDIGADSPEEIALAILAQVVGVRRGVLAPAAPQS